MPSGLITRTKTKKLKQVFQLFVKGWIHKEGKLEPKKKAQKKEFLAHLTKRKFDHASSYYLGHMIEIWSWERVPSEREALFHESFPIFSSLGGIGFKNS